MSTGCHELVRVAAQGFRLGGACCVLVLRSSSGDHVHELLPPATFLISCWPPPQPSAPRGGARVSIGRRLLCAGAAVVFRRPRP